MTLSRVIAEAEARLSAAGIDSARTDAELLAAHVLGVDRGRLRTLLLLDAPIDADRAEACAALIEQRAARVPLQHLTGRAGFRHIEVEVGPGVFVPRPETELIVELATGLLGEAVGTPRIVDLCAGSAALTISLALEIPGSRVTGVEVSPAALEWARRNVAVHEDAIRRAGSTVDLVAADVRTPLGLGGGVDIVVANPPYVPPDAVPVDPEVARHDPSLALYGGGVDGLSIPSAVVDRAAELLRPGGWLVCEHAESQGEDMRRLLAAGGRFDSIDTGTDLATRPRFTFGKVASR